MSDNDKAILCSCSNEDCRWNGCMIVRQQIQKPEIVYAGISRGQIAKPCVYEDGRPLREIIESQKRELAAKDAEIDRLHASLLDLRDDYHHGSELHKRIDWILNGAGQVDKRPKEGSLYGTHQR